MRNKKEANALIAQCALVYFVSYLTRHGYAAGLVAISASMDVSASVAGLACTALFISYGAGQLLSGWVGDHISPCVMICGGLLGSALCNLLVPLVSSGAGILVWCINGLFQAMLWPPLVRLMVENLAKDEYFRGVRLVNIASNIGSMVVYALMSLFIYTASWKSYFYFAAIAGVVVTVVFWLGMRNIRSTKHVQEETAQVITNQPKGSLVRLILGSGVLFIMLANIMQGMLRDGVSTWMPTLISETAQLGASASVLSGVFLPLFAIVCIQVAGKLQKRIPNEARGGMQLFLAGACSSLAILLLLGRSTLPVIVLTAVLTGCMHGANYLLVCNVPQVFARYGCVSSMAGIINSCTYIGSAVSTYGIALLSEHFGWSVTIGSWLVIALLGALCCAVAIKRWGRFVKG